MNTRFNRISSRSTLLAPQLATRALGKMGRLVSSLSFASLVFLSTSVTAQTLSHDFPPVPRVGQALTPPAAQESPNLKNMMRVVPLSITAPTLVVPGMPDTRPSGQIATLAALPREDIESGATSIAQVLGSTSNGTITKAYTITHLRAMDMLALVADPAMPMLSRETSTVVADARSNTLMVKGTEAEHQLVENLIRRVDVPVKQILLEVKIITADEYFGVNTREEVPHNRLPRIK